MISNSQFSFFFYDNYYNCYQVDFLRKKFQSSPLLVILPYKIATRGSKRKLVAINKENYEEHHRSNFAQNTNVPRTQEDYIAQFSEEIEGWVTKKLSIEFSRMESCILGTLFRLDEFLLNPLIQGPSGPAQETSQNALGTNQRATEDASRSDSLPKARVAKSQTT